MEGDVLFGLIKEKQRRIQDLERLVEDQKRLRIQDASQVEEKAAKIKAWVVNKLEELEKQNKQLREQNKKQKEVVESLVSKMATLDTTDRTSPIYDSVSLEQTFFHKMSKDPNCLAIRTNDIKNKPSHENKPPPPKPAHQIDIWESELYNLVDSEPILSVTLEPTHQTFTSQAVSERRLFQLSPIFDIDLATKYERSLMLLMRTSSRRCSDGSSSSSDFTAICPWLDKSPLVYSHTPIIEPLTSLPNETLCKEALELFKSILLFTQVPIKPVAIDYHVSLLQNCLSRFLRHPELRNEFFAQLIKQCTYVRHRCSAPKTPSSGKKRSSILRQRSDSSCRSISPIISGGCQLVTNLDSLDLIGKQSSTLETSSTLSHIPSINDHIDTNESIPPSKSEMLQTIQVLSIAVSLDLPSGRVRCWLVECLRKFADPKSTVGKYALYTLKALDRTALNGTRENIPSRMEIMSILCKNPYDHSSPHSLPVTFLDESYLLIGVDGSTSVEEFMSIMSESIDIRCSPRSDFHIFADDPTGSKELHILQPQKKILDVVGWWEQLCRRHNSGKYQNTRAIKLICKKRLILVTRDGETHHERKLIVHQIHQEVVQRRIPISDTLIAELGAVMAQLTLGNYRATNDRIIAERLLVKVSKKFLPNKSSHAENLIERWKKLCGLSAQDCVRVYLKCIRRLKLNE